MLENDHDFEVSFIVQFNIAYIIYALISYYYFGQDKKSYVKESIGKESSAFGAPVGLHKSNPSRETISGQRATIAKICEEGKIFFVLKHYKLWQFS